jgi:hypothetical protein
MIVDIKLKLDDFEFNFNKLRALYNKESDLLKSNFIINNRVDWIEFQEYVRRNNSQYSEFISDFSSYEFFYCDIIRDLMQGKMPLNQKITEYYNKYMVELDHKTPASSTSVFVISHALVNNPLRYWDETTKTITYNEVDLFKRLLVLNSIGLLNRNKFGMDLMKILTIHHGIIEITKKDINDCLSDLDHRTAVA